MSNNKKSGGMGYYITLTLCAAAIAVAGFFYYRNTGEETSNPADPVADVAVIPEQEQDVEAVATQGTDATVGTENTTAPTERKALKTCSPVAGETVSGYVMEALAYNETTRDWRTHNGIDISAEVGTPVLAAASGEVYTVYEDDAMGTTVVIRHQDGYTTMYSSLDADVNVSVGDKVEMGQTIGTVGETALLENAIGPHVHFAVTCNDEPMDPAEFLALS